MTPGAKTPEDRPALLRRARGAWRRALGRRRVGGARGETPKDGVKPENFVWIFGTGRTGSSWLAAMMEEIDGHAVWFEPRVGDLFDPQRFERYKGQNFILSARYKETWLGSVRNFVLDGANARFPELAGRPDGYLVVKEPGGSGGAGLLLEALPESRVVLLVRDPRDVVASWMDASRKGGWQNERRRGPSSDSDPDAFARRYAESYLRNVGSAREAYGAHPGRRVVVRYEDLRSDPRVTMGRLYSELGVQVDEGDLALAVDKHSWENIPEEEKGRGKFYRKGEAGGWREDLTPAQVKLVEGITAPLLDEFYGA